MAADDAADAAALLEQLAVSDPTTLETLPEELHPLILQFLDARSLVAAAGVCRAWQRLTETIAFQKLHHAWPFEELPPSRLRALCAHDAITQTFGFPEAAETVRAMSEWRLLRIEQVMRMAQGDPARLEVLRAHVLEHMSNYDFMFGRLSAGSERRSMDPQIQWMMEHGWRYDEDAVALNSYVGSYAVAAAFRNERPMCTFAWTSVDRNAHALSSELLSELRLPSLLQLTCYRLWVSFSNYAWSAEEQADIPDEPDIPEAQLHVAEARVYPAPDAFAALTGEFSLGDEDPAWLNLLQAAPGFAFDSRCISVCMAANDLNFPDDGDGWCDCFRTPVRVDGVVEYRLRVSPIVRFVSAPRDRSGCHSLIPVDHDTFRVPPLARIRLERIDAPGEWNANGHVIRQRCYTVSLSYG